jgi:hypothetical protein
MVAAGAEAAGVPSAGVAAEGVPAAGAPGVAAVVVLASGAGDLRQAVPETITAEIRVREKSNLDKGIPMITQFSWVTPAANPSIVQEPVTGGERLSDSEIGIVSPRAAGKTLSVRCR